MANTEQDNLNVEAALVVRAKAGDSSAFSELVKLYQRRAVSVAYRLLGNTDDAMDVAQDAFIRTHRKLDQLEDPSRFGPWMLRTVSNLSLNYRRSRKSNQVSSFEDAQTLAGDFVRPLTGKRWSTEGSETLSDEMHGVVQRAIDSLPENQRLALILFSVEGLPQKEVAEILDCTVELVKWNVFQARKKLKELLSAHL